MQIFETFSIKHHYLLHVHIGFMGKVLIDKLLRTCPGIENIYLLIRKKKGKDIHTRIDELFDDPVMSWFWFDFLITHHFKHNNKKKISMSTNCIIFFPLPLFFHLSFPSTSHYYCVRALYTYIHVSFSSLINSAKLFQNFVTKSWL